jgi:hypothetical protein
MTEELLTRSERAARQGTGNRNFNKPLHPYVTLISK